MPNHLSCLLAFALLFGLVGAAGPALADVEVTRATTCMGVADREPVEPTDEFSVDAGRAYTWCEVLNAEGTTLQHVYYFEGTRTDVVNLTVRSDRFRTWSYKTLRPGRVGDWRVEIVIDDAVLHSLEFFVVPGTNDGE